MKLGSVAFGRSPWLLACLLFTAFSASAQAVLKGQVLRDQLGGAPIGGVQVFGDGANPSATDEAGRFELRFPSRRIGDSVRITIRREGWVVVNDQQLERELPRDPNARPLVVVLSKAEEREKWALLHFRLRGTQLADGAERRRPANALMGDLGNASRERALERVDALAELLAKSIPEGSLLAKARSAFSDGRFEDALRILDERSLGQWTRQAEREAKSAQAKLVEAGNTYQFKADLLWLQQDLNGAIAAAREAARLDPDQQWFLAIYLAKSERYQEAEELFSRLLKKARAESDVSDIQAGLQNLSNVYLGQGRMQEAVDAQEESIAMHRRNSAYFSGKEGLARSLSALGRLYVFTNDERAIQSLRESIEIYETLPPRESAGGLLEALTMLADTLRRRGDANGADAALTRAHQFFEKTDAISDEFDVSPLTMLYFAGRLSSNGSDKAAQALRASAIAKARKDAAASPLDYKGALAMVLVNAAAGQDFETAERLLKEAISLVDSPRIPLGPTSNADYFAGLFRMKLAELYERRGWVADAIAEYLRVVNSRIQNATQAFYVSSSLLALSKIRGKLGQNERARMYVSEAVKLMRFVAQEDSSSGILLFAVLMAQAEQFLDDNDGLKALALADEAVSATRQFVRDRPEANFVLAAALTEAGKMSANLRDMVLAKGYLSEAIDIWNAFLARGSPSNRRIEKPTSNTARVWVRVALERLDANEFTRGKMDDDVNLPVREFR